MYSYMLNLQKSTEKEQEWDSSYQDDAEEHTATQLYMW